jgi:hypothetical protein
VSWTTLVPFSGYQPTTVWAKVLTLGEVSSGLLIIAIVLGTFIGRADPVLRGSKAVVPGATPQ